MSRQSEKQETEIYVIITSISHVSNGDRATKGRWAADELDRGVPGSNITSRD